MSNSVHIISENNDVLLSVERLSRDCIFWEYVMTIRLFSSNNGARYIGISAVL